MLAAAGGYSLRQSFTGPLYQPGDVRAGKNLRVPLDPPVQPNEPGVWLVDRISACIISPPAGEHPH
jgi:hypothetical protein